MSSGLRYSGPIVLATVGQARVSAPPAPVSSQALPFTVSSPKVASLPMTILFGETPDSPDEYTIPAKHVALLPPMVRDKLVKDSDMLEGKNMKIVTLSSSMWLDALLRLREYLDHKDYAPFNPATPLKVVDDANVEYQWQNNMSVDRLLRTSDATFQLFVKEIRLYAFATTLEYTELRLFCSSKIRTAYPVLARETLALIDQLYMTAVGIKDNTLIEFIQESAIRNSDKLVQHTKYTELFRQRMAQIQDPITRMLLDVQLTASTKSAANRFLAEQLRMIPPTGPRELESSKWKEEVADVARVIATMYDLLMQERLVIARRDGFGTLLSMDGSYSRNKDFTFQKSEILVADYSRKAFNGKHNVTVINAKGQQGDILGTLFDFVPVSLGIASEPVNLGKRPREESPVHRDRAHKHIKSEEQSPPYLGERIEGNHQYYR